MKKTVKRAKRLLKALEKHAGDAVDNGVPEALYVQSVAQHASSIYTRLLEERQGQRKGVDDPG